MARSPPEPLAYVGSEEYATAPFADRQLPQPRVLFRADLGSN